VRDQCGSYSAPCHVRLPAAGPIGTAA
jgi:hypothetical protein